MHLVVVIVVVVEVVVVRSWPCRLGMLGKGTARGGGARSVGRGEGAKCGGVMLVLAFPFPLVFYSFFSA